MPPRYRDALDCLRIDVADLVAAWQEDVRIGVREVPLFALPAPLARLCQSISSRAPRGFLSSEVSRVLGAHHLSESAAALESLVSGLEQRRGAGIATLHSALTRQGAPLPEEGLAALLNPTTHFEREIRQALEIDLQLMHRVPLDYAELSAHYAEYRTAMSKDPNGKSGDLAAGVAGTLAGGIVSAAAFYYGDFTGQTGRAAGALVKGAVSGTMRWWTGKETASAAEIEQRYHVKLFELFVVLSEATATAEQRVEALLNQTAGDFLALMDGTLESLAVAAAKGWDPAPCAGLLRQLAAPSGPRERERLTRVITSLQARGVTGRAQNNLRTMFGL